MLVAFGSKIFSPTQLKMSIYSKEFKAIYMAFLEFAHLLWEATKPTIVLKDNKSVTRFFQTKAIPASLWNACDYVLQFNFKKAHIAGSVNTAADFVSRLELKVTDKIRLNIREDAKTMPIDVTTSLQMLQMESNPSSHWQTVKTRLKSKHLRGKKQSGKKATERVPREEPSSMKPNTKEITKIDGNTTSYSIPGIKANARIRIEQDFDLVLKNLKLKIFGQRYDEVLLTTDKHLSTKKNE